MGKDQRFGSNYGERFVIHFKDQYYGGMKPITRTVVKRNASIDRKTRTYRTDTVVEYENTGKFIPYFVDSERVAKTFKTKNAAKIKINSLISYFNVDAKMFNIKEIIRA